VGFGAQGDLSKVGFALWIRDGVAWAQGTHEYRPMGTAVISARGTFTPRDFDRRRAAPPRLDPGLAGLFASLGAMNDFLKKHASRKSRSRGPQLFFKDRAKYGPPVF
jgi:hypothetical protein